MAFLDWPSGTKVQGAANGLPDNQKWLYTDAELVRTRINELKGYIETLEAIVDAPEGTILLRQDGAGTGNVDAYGALEAYTILQTEMIQCIPVALSDLTSDLALNGQAAYFRAPSDMRLVGISASVLTAPVGDEVEVQVYDDGVAILSTSLTIDDGEKTSATAATPAVIGNPAILADSEIVFEIANIGSTTAGAGLVVVLKFYREV